MTDNNEQERLDRLQKTIEETRGLPFNMDVGYPFPQNRNIGLLYLAIVAILIAIGYFIR